MSAQRPASSMASREELPRSQWHESLELLTKDYENDDVTVEVLSREYGDQYEAETLPLAYVEYDHKDDVFIVGVGGRDGRYPVVLNHMIPRPQRILITPAVGDHPLAMAVVAPNGTETIVTLHRRPALPGPD